MAEKFFISLRKTYNLDADPVVLYLTPTDHALSKLWSKMLKENFLNKDSHSNCKGINKLFCFHAWQQGWDDNTYSRNLDVVCKELNTAIERVNFYYNKFGYPYIDLEFTKDKLKDTTLYREMMNELHHHFEILIGQVGNTSEWYFKPPQEAARFYVQQLNSLLHEIESTVNAIVNENKEKHIMINFNGPRANGTYIPDPIRVPLTEEHFECFEDRQHQWGMLTAYYSQLGKQHIEVFVDGDEVIGDENISGISWMMGECILDLETLKGPNESPRKRITEEFKSWLVKNGFDPEDKSLALGLGILAYLKPEDNQHLGSSWQEIDKVIHQYDDVYEIGFCDENYNLITHQKYDYTWKDYQLNLSLAYGDHL